MYGMTKENIKEQFICFLEENNCKYKYFYNNETQYKKRFRDWIDLFENLLDDPRELINCAFSWYYTSEGEDFWQDLHSEWLHIYNTYINLNKFYYKNYNEIWND